MSYEFKPIDEEAKSGKKFILSMINRGGYRVEIMGCWIGKFKMEEYSDCVDGDDCDEKDGVYYAPEGWYEIVQSHDEYTYLQADGDVTHYAPVPKVVLQ